MAESYTRPRTPPLSAMTLQAPTGDAPAVQTIIEALLRALFEGVGLARWRWPGQLLPDHHKRQAELRSRSKGILFFLKRSSFFSFVGE